jgi:hypothetical protein
MRSKLLALILLVAAMSAAQAQVVYVNGNDTGGIIPWSPESELMAVSVAGGHCAGYGKLARITSVYREYGHYIGFSCAFPRGYIIQERAVAIRAKG